MPVKRRYIKLLPVKIEKNVPIPRSALARYPFAAMEVGDSLHIEADDKEQTRARAAATRYAIINGIKFVTRKTDTGFRIWRIK